MAMNGEDQGESGSGGAGNATFGFFWFRLGSASRFSLKRAPPSQLVGGESSDTEAGRLLLRKSSLPPRKITMIPPPCLLGAPLVGAARNGKVVYKCCRVCNSCWPGGVLICHLSTWQPCTDHVSRSHNNVVARLWEVLNEFQVADERDNSIALVAIRNRPLASVLPLVVHHCSSVRLQ